MGKYLGLLVFSADQFRKGTSVQLVKGTSHIGMKETRAKTTVINSASSDRGCLKEEEEDGQINDLTVVCQKSLEMC